MKFELHQKVAWVSQSNGTRKEKHGKVIRIVPAGQEALGGGTRYGAWETYIVPGSIGQVRNHESYLVEVREGKRKPKLYWPRVTALEED